RADLVAANLECPLVQQLSPITKTGPCFGAPVECIKGIKNAGISLLNLANNHILDQGPAGLHSTLKACADAGVTTVGAGPDLAVARRMEIRLIDGLRVGFVSMAEHEFSIAGSNSPGANPLDLIDFVRNVRDNREKVEYLVVFLHGAHEFQPITPRIQNTCRFLIEMGANAVLVQHPHSLGGYENYLGGHIVYGQGALVMDEGLYRDLATFHEGFLVKLNIARGASSLEIIPFTQSDPRPGARRMRGDKEAGFRRMLAERNQKILDPEFVRSEWHRFCRQHRNGYLAGLLGFNRALRKANINGVLFPLLYGRRLNLGVRNSVQCETHREALQTILGSEPRQDP
ncbi:hypothetical protein EG829_26250, partial [bacterium]|nr:hypothetical protein [bacterium]